MKKYLILNFIAMLFIISCKSDLKFEPDIFPYVMTKSVGENDATGVKFLATLLPVEGQEVTEMGFIWRKLNQSVEYTVLADQVSNQDFSARISCDILKGNTYSYRGYVKGSGFYVLGNLVDFNANGGLPPEIKDFFPKSCPPFSNVTIRGHNLSHSKEAIIVSLGTYSANVLRACPDSVVFTVPKIKSGKYIIKINLPFTYGTMEVKDSIQIFNGPIPTK